MQVMYLISIHTEEELLSQPLSLEQHQLYFSTEPSFKDMVNYFQVLAHAEGGKHAFSIIIGADLSGNIDSHLLAHAVGDIMYTQEGFDGMKYCTNELGFACAHTVVINGLLDRGIEVFDIVNSICEIVPGFSRGYNQCFHGFGHGVLAYAEYEVPDAIALCQKVGTEKHNYREIDECVGGVIMEMRGGIHDVAMWEKNGKKYLDEKMPLSMCLAEYMPEANKDYCLAYMTPFLFDATGAGDLPVVSDYARAMILCEELRNDLDRSNCYGGFAKEFLSFIFGRDIRRIPTATEENMRSVYAACEEAPNEFGLAACVKYAVYTFYKGGVAPYTQPGKFCSIVDDRFKPDCFTTLHDRVLSDNIGPEQAGEFCAYLADVYKPLCTSV